MIATSTTTATEDGTAAELQGAVYRLGQEFGHTEVLKAAAKFIDHHAAMRALYDPAKDDYAPILYDD